MTDTIAKDRPTTSERGLRLIKAFEGFRPVDRVLVTGTRVVGHGHRLTDDRAVFMTREEAHDILLDDLAPFEDMIAENAFAPLTQGQFDALVSLAFNIGPRAFLDSDVLASVNAGRPLDAAAGFDVWRRADVMGETFVVDALVRRRTAEKALFLRPSDNMLSARAPGSDITPARDASVATRMDAPTLDRNDAGRLVSDAPYELSRLIVDTQSLKGRRRDDGPLGEMALTELADVEPAFEPGGTYEAEDNAKDEDESAEDTIYSGLDSALLSDRISELVDDELPMTETRSPIADAADEVRDRLDALMEQDLMSRDRDTGVDDIGIDDIGIDGNGTDAQIDTEFETIEDLIQSGSIVEDVDADILDLEGPEETDTVVQFPTRATRLAAPDPVITDTSTLEPVLTPEPDFVDVRMDADNLAPDNLAPDNLAIDSLAQDAAMRSRGTMGELPDADWSPSTLAEPKGPSAWPYVVMFALGGVLFGTGAMLMTRGAGAVMGQPRELVGLAAALIGAMIILGALITVLKTTFEGDPR